MFIASTAIDRSLFVINQVTKIDNRHIYCLTHQKNVIRGGIVVFDHGLPPVHSAKLTAAFLALHSGIFDPKSPKISR
jgi:hypothetical protein